jgi:hypothetical protein
MTRFASPALHQPNLPLAPALIRSALGLLAVVFTAAVWIAAGMQAGQYGDRDHTPRVELAPVVVSGHRLLPDDRPLAMGAAPAVDCGNTQAGAGANRVTLNQ